MDVIQLDTLVAGPTVNTIGLCLQLAALQALASPTLTPSAPGFPGNLQVSLQIGGRGGGGGENIKPNSEFCIRCLPGCHVFGRGVQDSMRTAGNL